MRAGGAYGHALRNALFPKRSGYLPGRSASWPAISGLVMAATLKDMGRSKKACGWNLCRCIRGGKSFRDCDRKDSPLLDDDFRDHRPDRRDVAVDETLQDAEGQSLLEVRDEAEEDTADDFRAVC